MWSFRILGPFLAISLSSIIALIVLLLITGRDMDHRATAASQDYLIGALEMAQRQLANDAQKMAALANSMPNPHFLQRMPHQLHQGCIWWVQQDRWQNGGCTEPPYVSAPPKSLMPLTQAQRMGLIRHQNRVWLFATQPMAKPHESLLMITPIDDELLARWATPLALKHLKITPNALDTVSTASIELHDYWGQTIGYLNYPLPLPGKGLVKAALLPLLVVIALILLIALLMARKLSQLMRSREQSEARLRQVIDLVPHMIYARNPSGQFILANQATARFFQSTPEAMLGLTAAELSSHGDILESTWATERTVIESGHALYMQEEQLPDRQGQMHQWQSSKLRFTDQAGEAAVLSIAIDVTEQRVQAQQLQLMSTALERSGSAVMLTAGSGEILYINERFTQQFGYSTDELLGQSLMELMRHYLGAEQRIQIVKTMRQKGQWRGELSVPHRRGGRFWLMVSIAPLSIEAKGTTPEHFVVVAEDITELKQAHQKMENLAFYDTLTGLENRRLFKERLQQAIRDASRYEHLSALLYLDLDRFKRINDTLGHDAGDQLLMTTAKRLKACVREADSVARLGGDEFTILLHRIRAPEVAAHVANKIIKALAAPIQLGQQNIIVTTSIGITLLPQDSDTPTGLLKNADLAMYRAKQEGRNNYQFFTPEMNTRASHLLRLETELRDALEQRHFTLHYQPQIHLKTGKVTGFEALVRWNHPQHGMIPPLDFISVAEETGQIVELGYQVLEQACREIKQLRETSQQPYYVAVNLSPRQLRDPGLVHSIAHILERTGLPAKKLELEITETALMEQIDQSLALLQDLEALGVTLSIDDFGTGYSSLSYLKQLPVHSLKIDRSFVRDIPTDPDDMAIIAAVTAMAQKLNIEVVAEGLETEQQFHYLRHNHCTLVQGYLFSPPVPFDQLKATCIEIQQTLTDMNRAEVQLN